MSSTLPIQHKRRVSFSHLANELQTVYIVLPAYNEAVGLVEMLDELSRLLSSRPFDYQVLVVDDGSADDTASIARAAAKELPVTVICHELNQGLAATIRTGLEAAVKIARPTDVIVTMDADNTQPIGLIPLMVETSNAGRDVVVASRFRKGARVVGVPFYRQITSLGVAAMFKLLFPIRGIRDYTCGFRAYKCSTLKEAVDFYGDKFITENGFACMVDILLKLSYRKAVMTELPMVLRYDYKDGASKMDVQRTIADTLRLAWRRRTGVMD